MRNSVFIISVVLLLVIPAALVYGTYTPHAPTRSYTGRAVLFDASKNEQAGNADWVISGAYSDFAAALRSEGFKVDSTTGSTITYTMLSSYNVYVIPEAQRPFSQEEADAIYRFVCEGGGLLLIADHGNSDRDNDGWDSPHIYNEKLFSETRFQMKFNYDNKLKEPITYFTASDITAGLTSVGIYSGCTITLKTNATGQVFVSSSKTDPWVVSATVGRGRVVGVGDSSVFDDGTAAGGSTSGLHKNWQKLSHAKLGVNIIKWLSCAVTPVPPDVYMMIPDEYYSGQLPVPLSSPGNTTIKIGSFNPQVLGPSKISNPTFMSAIKQIIRSFDVLLLMEVKDSTNTVARSLMDYVNANETVKYSYSESEGLGDSTNKENYMYIWKNGTVALVGTPYVYNDVNNWFSRPPYIATFKAGSFDFTLIGIHTPPSNATAEIMRLSDVVNTVKQANPLEEDVIILGDLNADGTYFDEKNMSCPLRAVEYRWLISNEMDTTASTNTNCTYDRIICTRNSTHEYVPGSAGVQKYSSESKPNITLSSSISDHYPVYARFYVELFDDDGSVPDYPSPPSVANTTKIYYAVDVAGARLVVNLREITDDPYYNLDLYIKKGALPSLTDYDAKSSTSQNTEKISINNATGTYFIMIYGVCIDPIENPCRAPGRFKIWASFNQSSAQEDTTPPQIMNISVSRLEHDIATVSFTTSEKAKVSIHYGNTSALTQTAEDPSFKTVHEISLTGLLASTTYKYQITAQDSSGNIGQSAVYTFTTPVKIVWLSVGEIYNSGISAGSSIYFGFNISYSSASGQSLLILNLTSSNGAALELYLRKGSLPSVTNYDVASLSGESNRSLTTPLNISENCIYYLLLRSINSPGNFSIKSAISNYNPNQNQTACNHLLISEVFYDTPGDDNVEEYIEIWNPTSTPVNLTGWKLLDNGGTYIFGSIILPAGCRLVIARNAAGFRSLFGINPTVEGLTLSLGNSGDKVILRNPQGTDVDMVAWEGYVSGWTISAATGQSIVRSNALDTDTSADWSSATPSPEM